MDHDAAKPAVLLTEPVDGSIAPTVFAIVDRGATLRPWFARDLRGAILLCFNGEHPPVRLDFGGDLITIGDANTADAVDLRVDADLRDLVALISVPLSGGVPKPTTRRGRAALAMLANGRVELTGPIALARRLLRVMSVVD